MNRLTSVTQPAPSTDTTAPVTTYDYNADGEQVAMTDPDGNTTYYTYNNVGEETSEIESDGSKWTYSYDPNGNLTSTTDADGRTTQYTYDALNRVTAENWIGSDGSTVNSIQYTYNDQGQLETVGDSNSSYTYTYNDAGQVASIDNTGTPDVADVVLNQSYDGFGNLSTLSAAVAGTTQLTNTYQYDADGNMTNVSQSGSAVSDKQANFTYNADGQLTTINTYASTDTSAPVATTTYGYDQASRLISLTHTNASMDTTIAAYGYTYNADGQITTMTSPDGTTNYTYDNDGQLTGASGSALPAAESYTYDANGNRTGASITTATNNQIATDGTYDYAYDADGNLITQTTIATGATTNYTWDYRNRLTEITYKNSSGTITEQIEYTYDAFNRRISQSIDPTGGGDFTEVTYYVYDSNGNLLMTLNDSGAVTHTYLNGPGTNQVLADDAGSGSVSWLLADQQGTVRDVIDSSGTELDHLKYDAYGNILSQSDSANQPAFGFAGMQLDSTGLYYDNARYYDPSTGTFLSQDPSGSSGSGSNLYGYTNGDPINLVDPSGLSPKGNGHGGGGPGGGPGAPGGGSGGGGGSSGGWGGTIGAIGRAVGGIAEIAVGLSLAEAGIGVPIALHGADEFGTAIGDLLNGGTTTSSLTSQGLQALGLSQQNADAADMAISMLDTLGGGAIAEGAQAIAESDAGASALSDLLSGDATAWNGLSSQAQSLALAGALSESGETAAALQEFAAANEAAATAAEAGAAATGATAADAVSAADAASEGSSVNPSDSLNEAPSSKALGQNLEDSGVSRPADTAAHHIVAGSDPRVAEARAILQNEGIGINDADNGVFLPKNSSVPNPTGAQVHSTVHTNVYYNAVNAALRNAQPGTVGDVLNDIASQLLNGTFPH